MRDTINMKPNHTPHHTMNERELIEDVLHTTHFAFMNRHKFPNKEERAVLHGRLADLEESNPTLAQTLDTILKASEDHVKESRRRDGISLVITLKRKELP